jgi:hypothetical protein
LQENDLDDYAVLKQKTAAASEKFQSLSNSIKELDAKLNDNAALQKHIVTYVNLCVKYILAALPRSRRPLERRSGGSGFSPTSTCRPLGACVPCSPPLSGIPNKIVFMITPFIGRTKLTPYSPP